MATMEEVINQAISDFDDIEAAIEEMGVDVPEGTDTKEYANYIRKIAGVGNVDQEYNPESENAQSGKAVAGALNTLPVKYIESLDKENYLNLYDLESGTYILYGYFLVYPNATKRFTFSKKMLVSVSHGSVSTCVQVFYPPYNTIQYLNIYPPDEEAGTGYTYERKDAELYYMESTENKVTSLDETATDEQYPSAKAVYDKVKDTSNALKANASGEVIRVDDVSPIEHTVKAKVSGKNFFDISQIAPTKVSATTTYISEVGEDYVIICTPENVYGHAPTEIALRDICPNCKEGETYVLSAVSSSPHQYLYLVGANVAWYYGGTKVLTEEMLSSKVVLYGNNTQEGGEVGSCTISNIQIEKGDTATEFEPYIDPTTVTVTRCGKNLFNTDEYSVSVGNLITNEVEEHKYTVEGDVGTATLAYSAGAITFRLPNNIKVVDSVSISLYVTLLEQGAYDNRLRVWGMSEDGANEYGTVTLTKGTRKKISCTYSSGVGALTGIMFYLNNNKLLLEADTLQVEFGEAATDYEAYNGTTYTPAADGTCEIVSVSPTMTLLTDTEGANIEIEYNQDNNAFADNVKSDLKELDRVTADLLAKIPSAEIKEGILYVK